MEAQFVKRGARCSVGACNQYVYLPYKCDQCQRPFCEEHRLYTDHQCEFHSQAIVPVCPKCLLPVPIPLGQSGEQVLKAHIASGCEVKPTVPKHKPCGVLSCQSSHPFQVICHQCKAVYCVSHRLPEEHSCPVSFTKEPRCFPRLPPSSEAAKPMSSTAPSASAIGPKNVHMDDQVQFFVHLPELTTGAKKQPVCMPKKWSVGKVVDWLCDHFKIPNTTPQQRHRFVTANVQAPQVLPNHITLSQANTVADNGARFPDVRLAVVLIPEEWLSLPAPPAPPAEPAPLPSGPGQRCGAEDLVPERLRSQLILCLGQ
eukprot:EG_transcript_20279